MSWSYDPKSLSTGDGRDLLTRTELEEAADRLWKAGIRNQALMVDILKALSGLSHGEVKFTIQLSSFDAYRR